MAKYMFRGRNQNNFKDPTYREGLSSGLVKLLAPISRGPSMFRYVVLGFKYTNSNVHRNLHVDIITHLLWIKNLKSTDHRSVSGRFSTRIQCSSQPVRCLSNSHPTHRGRSPCRAGAPPRTIELAPWGPSS